jgi:hypothetical protein
MAVCNITVALWLRSFIQTTVYTGPYYLSKIFKTYIVHLLHDFRQALNDAKKQNHNLMERVQSMQSELSEAEVARSELDGQIRQGHTVSC